MLPVFDKLFECFWGKEIIYTFSENIKCGHLKKNWVIYHSEGKRLTIGPFLMVTLSTEIMQIYPKHYPQKGVRVIYPDSAVTENA